MLLYVSAHPVDLGVPKNIKSIMFFLNLRIFIWITILKDSTFCFHKVSDGKNKNLLSPGLGNGALTQPCRALDQTKFLYWAKLVDSVTRLQLPADLVKPVTNYHATYHPYKNFVWYRYMNKSWTPSLIFFKQKIPEKFHWKMTFENQNVDLPKTF